MLPGLQAGGISANALASSAVGSNLTLLWNGVSIGWMGDSISLAITSNAPAQYASALRGVANWSISGANWISIGNIPTQYTNNITNQTRLIMEGGVNDMAGDALAPALLSVVMAFVDARLMEGKQIILNTIGPWAGYSGSNASRQTQTVAYNALLALATSQRPLVKLVDLQALWQNPAAPGFMLPAYDSGDGIHPNTTGGAVWAAAVAAVAP